MYYTNTHARVPTCANPPPPPSPPPLPPAYPYPSLCATAPRQPATTTTLLPDGRSRPCCTALPACPRSQRSRTAVEANKKIEMGRGRPPERVAGEKGKTKPLFRWQSALRVSFLEYLYTGMSVTKTLSRRAVSGDRGGMLARVFSRRAFRWRLFSKREKRARYPRQVAHNNTVYRKRPWIE